MAYFGCFAQIPCVYPTELSQDDARAAFGSQTEPLVDIQYVRQQAAQRLCNACRLQETPVRLLLLPCTRLG